MSATAQIEERAAQWLIRSEEADWSASDQADLEEWLDESMAHKAAYWRLEHSWRAADGISALGSLSEGSEPKRGRLERWWKPVAIAASLIAVVSTGVVLVEPAPDAPTAYAQGTFGTRIGGQQTVDLADGSRVELNTSTTVRTALTNEVREVWLDAGEAYFDVVHSEGRPFVVHAGKKKITVLGTKFSVKRGDSGRIMVSVMEGLVSIEDVSAKTVPPKIVEAGGIAIADGSSTLLTERSEQRVQNALAWRGGMLTIENMTLEEAANEFNRYNHKQIVIADSQAADIRIGGTFETSNVDAFARLLRDAYGLKVESDEETIRISQ